MTEIGLSLLDLFSVRNTSLQKIWKISYSTSVNSLVNFYTDNREFKNSMQMKVWQRLFEFIFENLNFLIYKNLLIDEKIKPFYKAHFDILGLIKDYEELHKVEHVMHFLSIYKLECLSSIVLAQFKLHPFLDQYFLKESLGRIDDGLKTSSNKIFLQIAWSIAYERHVNLMLQKFGVSQSCE